MSTRILMEAEASREESDHRMNPQSQLERAQRQQVLLDSMEKLAPRARSMLLLHYFHGLKFEAIAEILETTVGAVKVAVHRGRRELRAHLSRSGIYEAEGSSYEDALH
jgi:RNA polymerase sigma-70 factor (ECF subfamily)